MRWLSRPLFRDPLLHFAAAGAAIFLLYSVRSGTPAAEHIIVTTETVQALIENRQRLLGRPISPDERRRVIQEYVNEEIMVREGYARGIEKHDSRVRQRLIEIMRFLLEEEPPEPSLDDLKTFLKAHEDVYRSDQTISFSHVFFEKNGKAVPDSNLLQRLCDGEDHRKFGSRFWLGSKMEQYSERELAQILGPEFVRAISHLPKGQWNGPIGSSLGLHFVRIDGSLPAQLPPFDSISSTLRTDWLHWKRGAMLDAKIDELRRRYQVEIQTGNEH
jgi:hypothetical protein